MDSEKIKKIGKISLISIAIIIVISLSGFAIWAYTPPKPLDIAIEALEPSDSVEITKTNRYYSFKPKNTEASIGFIFYPGARVDPRSYAPSAKGLAEEGFCIVIMIMPFNLAIFSVDAGTSIPDEFLKIEKWAIGGHSLGGAMAAQCVLNNPTLFDGLIFWASYPAANLAEMDLKVLSIYGTLDGLTNLDEIEDSRQNLPASTIWIEIEGGNHANFGYYGPQVGDNEATISQALQQQQILSATSSFLSTL